MTETGDLGSILSSLDAQGASDRLWLEDLYTLTRNLVNAVKAGDQDWVDELLAERQARLLVRQALDDCEY